MDIRCSECQHVGPAAEVLPTAEGVVLVCENCGHHNPLDVGKKASSEEAEAKPQAVDRSADRVASVADVSAASSPDSSGESPLLRKGALEKLIPVEGPGPRCRKCAHLLADIDEFCARCGLSVEDAEKYSEGEAPWERPPPGKEAVFEQATLLWKSLQENPTDESLIKFANFAREEVLLEYGVRQLRFFLVEHPNNTRATEYLEELASSFQAKMIVAQAQAQVRADNFTHFASRLKNVLLWVVLLTWGGIFLYFLTQVLKSAN